MFPDSLSTESIPEILPAIDMNVDGQLALLKEFQRCQGECPFVASESSDLRYIASNTQDFRFKLFKLDYLI